MGWPEAVFYSVVALAVTGAVNSFIRSNRSDKDSGKD